MHILVVDVAAEHGGAKTILDQFRAEFENDSKNEYLVLLSKLQYTDKPNIKYKRYPWVKKSHLHRLFFDFFTVKGLAKEYNADLIISLQNNAVNAGDVDQIVYFHNALPLAEKRFKFNESKYLWFYQTIISRVIKKSLRRAKTIYVQANWIKAAMITQWGIEEDKIVVKKPQITDLQKYKTERTAEIGKCKLFYPAGFCTYKNHHRMIKACKMIWDKYGIDCGLQLVLAGDREKLPDQTMDLIKDKRLPVYFKGILNRQEMSKEYLSSILIFPSYIETVGLPLLEAKDFGSKILCSDLAYSRESLGDYSNVVYFDPYSVDSIYEAILLSIKDCCFLEI